MSISFIGICLYAACEDDNDTLAASDGDDGDGDGVFDCLELVENAAELGVVDTAPSVCVGGVVAIILDGTATASTIIIKCR